MRVFGKSSCRHSSCERGLLLSIFDFKRKKYRTFLQDSETGEEMREDLIRKHYWFSGRVQGVGFRYRACYIASSLGVTGWVRNNWDERVEMEAQGTREDLARMVEMLYRQSFIGIEGVEEKVVPVEVESGFYAR